MGKKKILELDSTLCEKVIRLSATDYNIHIKTEMDETFEIIMFYNNEDMGRDSLLDIDVLGKEIFFHRLKCYSTETGCIDLAKYLQGKGYKVKGAEFLKKRRFKQGEFSLF